jgi:hypothetical protein
MYEGGVVLYVAKHVIIILLFLIILGTIMSDFMDKKLF